MLSLQNRLLEVIHLASMLEMSEEGTAEDF